MTRIAIVPQVSGVGGMVSFRDRFTAGLESNGIQVLNSINDPALDAVLVIGGTRDLPGLLGAKRKGIRIVQRLNGMNWLHRHLKTGLRHTLRAEYGNWVLGTIRSRLVNRVVYQSEFARDWWERVHGPTPVPSTVVYNAVDLAVFRPDNSPLGSMDPRPKDRYRVLLVEGSLMGGYEMGLESAVNLVGTLNDAHRQELGKPVELAVAGRVSESVKAKWSSQARFPLDWVGLVSPEEVIDLDRGAHLLYSADINPACPNAVIEALACGLPVLAFDSGALLELVQDGSWEVVPYGGDPWQLEKPDTRALASAAIKILTYQDRYRPAARTRAKTAFGLDKLVTGYLAALLD